MEIRENKRDIEKDIQKLGENRIILAKNTGALLYAQTDNFVEEEYQKSIAGLMQDKEHLADLISELEKLQESFVNEIENQKALDSEIKLLSKDWTNLLAHFGKCLLEEYTPRFSHFIGELYADYETQSLLVKSIAEKIDVERAEIEEMGFFSKILNQVKLSSTSANLTMQEKKLQKIFIEAGHLALQSGQLSQTSDEVLSKEALDSYTQALEMQELINEKKVLLEKSQNEEELISQNIDAIGPGGSFNKKKNSLEKQGAEIEANIDALYKKLGLAFFEEKIGDENKKTLKKPEKINDELFSLLKEAFEIQKKIEINQKKIAYLDLESEILLKDKQKKHLQQNIVQNNATIERLKEQNDFFAKTIVDIAEENDVLMKKKMELQKEIS